MAGKYVEFVREINRLTDDNKDLRRKLKQQYKRAKLAEECVITSEFALDKCECELQLALAAKADLEQHNHRLFVMLEHALEIKAKGI